jgi:hypothetical protein
VVGCFRSHGQTIASGSEDYAVTYGISNSLLKGGGYKIGTDEQMVSERSWYERHALKGVNCCIYVHLVTVLLVKKAFARPVAEPFVYICSMLQKARN